MYKNSKIQNTNEGLIFTSEFIFKLKEYYILHIAIETSPNFKQLKQICPLEIFQIS